MCNEKFWCRILFLFALVIHVSIAFDLYPLYNDIVYGDDSCATANISLRYWTMRVPKTTLALEYKADNRVSADFAQIYFPAKEKPLSLSNAYSSSTSMDPWHRPSRYAPFIHFVFAKTFCNLPYGPASLLHIVLQSVLFIASLAFAFKVLNIWSLFLPSMVLVDVCLFLSPVGHSWIERGQFSLYVGLSYLWLTMAFITQKHRYAIISAFFSYVKWTSFPYIFVAYAVYILSSKSNKELKNRIISLTLFAGVILLLLLSFPKDTFEFINGLRSQELSFEPGGLSLGRIIPLHVVKVLPFLLILVGYLSNFKNSNTVPQILPFLIGTAIILLTYPTLAYDYSAPYLTAFIPVMIYWRKVSDGHEFVKNFVVVSFLIFLLLASFSLEVFHSDQAVTFVYVTMSSFLLVAPFLASNNWRLIKTSL